jgi:hypothetical protein
MDDTVIKMDRADFFEMLAQVRLVEVLSLEAAAKIGPEEARKRKLVEDMAERYNFDPLAAWRYDTATCTLTLVKS